MSIGEVTGVYTPLHIVPALPATWYPELSVCAPSATRQGERATEKGSTPRCSLALTPSTPRRRGRAWIPVAPAARVSAVVTKVNGGLLFISISYIRNTNMAVTIGLDNAAETMAMTAEDTLDGRNVNAGVTMMGIEVATIATTTTVEAEVFPERIENLLMAMPGAQRRTKANGGLLFISISYIRNTNMAVTIGLDNAAETMAMTAEDTLDGRNVNAGMTMMGIEVATIAMTMTVEAEALPERIENLLMAMPGAQCRRTADNLSCSSPGQDIEHEVSSKRNVMNITGMRRQAVLWSGDAVRPRSRLVKLGMKRAVMMKNTMPVRTIATSAGNGSDWRKATDQAFSLDPRVTKATESRKLDQHKGDLLRACSRTHFKIVDGAQAIIML